jgi:hypothetical protein
VARKESNEILFYRLNDLVSAFPRTENLVFAPLSTFAPSYGCEHARPEENRNDRGTVNMMSTASLLGFLLTSGPLVIQRTLYTDARSVEYVGIDHRRRHILVPKQFLH